MRYGLSLLFGLALASAAHADPPTPTEADRLFEEGRALAKTGDFEGACARFAESLELDHSLGTELNLADCKEKLGQLREAWRLFTAVANESARSADAKRTAFARERAATVATKLATVVIKVARPILGMSITVGGHVVDPGTEIVDLVEPGAIIVVATAPNHPNYTTTVDAVANATVHLTIPPFADDPSHPPPPPPPIVVDHARDHARVRLAWGLGIGGVASAGAATAFALVGRSHYNDAANGGHCVHTSAGLRCDASGTDAIHAAQRLADIGTGFAIGAGALGIAAVVVYLTAPQVGPVTLAPVVGAREVGLGATLQW